MTSLPGADLEALLAVQGLDTELDQCRHRRATLPERAELVAINAQLAALAARAGAAAAQRDVVGRRQAELERTLAQVEGRAAEIKKRLYGGMVSATRELTAMAAEVDSLTGRGSELESQVLEAMEEREPLDALVDQIDGEKASLLAARTDAGEKLAAGEAEVDAQLEALHAARAQAAGEVPGELLATYESLRQHLGGTGVARLVGSRCGGCHLSLPATALDQLRRQSAGTISYCEQCGRILVPGAH